MENKAELFGALRLIGEKYDVNRENMEKELADPNLPVVVAVEIEHMSGKVAKRLVKK